MEKKFSKIVILLLVICTVAFSTLFLVSCNKKSCNVHSFIVAEVVEPTCNEAGYTQFKCQKCGLTYEGDETSPLEHHFVNDVCERCGEKKQAEELLDDYYLNFLKSLSEIKNVNLTTEDFCSYVEKETSYTDKDNNVHEFPKYIANKTDFILEHGLFELENGKLSIYGKGIYFSNNSEYNGFFIYKDHVFYADFINDNGHSPSYAVTGREENVTPLEPIPTIIEYAEKALPVIKNTLIDLTSGTDVEKSKRVAAICKKVFDILFTEEEVAEGRAFTFDKEKILLLKNLLSEKSLSDVCDMLFGEVAFDGVSSFIDNSLNKTILQAIEYAKTLGFDLDGVISYVDSILVNFGLQPDYLKNMLNSALENVGEITISELLCQATKLDSDGLYELIKKVLSDAKSKKISQFLAEYFGVTENDINSGLAVILEVINDSKITLKTDKNGGNLSLIFDLDCIVNQHSSGIMYLGFNKTQVVISGTVTLSSNANNIKEQYEEWIKDVDARSISFEPSKTYSINDAFVYNDSVNIDVSTDANGEIASVAMWRNGAESLVNYNYLGMKITVVYHFCKHENYYCELKLEDDDHNIYTVGLYWDPVQKAFFDFDSENNTDHNMEIIEEESDLRCGGYKKVKCTKCGFTYKLLIAHLGGTREEVEYANGGSSCTDIASVKKYCSECNQLLNIDVVTSHSCNYNKIKIDLSSYGERFIGEYLEISTCLCGQEKVGRFFIGYDAISHSFSEKCYYEDGNQTPIAKVTEVWERKGDCVEEKHEFYYVLSGEEFVEVYNIATGEFRVVHSYNRRDIAIDATKNETTHYINECACGSTKEVVIVDYLTYGEQQSTTINTRINTEIYITKVASNIERSYKKIYTCVSNAEGLNYINETTTEYYNADGEVIDTKTESVRQGEYTDIPEGFNDGWQVVRTEGQNIYKEITAWYGSVEYALYYYEYHETYNWVERLYEYDFENGCAYKIIENTPSGTTEKYIINHKEIKLVDGEYRCTVCDQSALDKNNVTGDGFVIDYIPEAGFLTITINVDQTAVYTLQSKCRQDTYAELWYDDQIILSDDDEGENNNFKINYRLEAGKEYQLKARFYSQSSSGTITVYITKE